MKFNRSLSKNAVPLKISVVIPTYNEAENIAHLIYLLKTHSNEALQEIIISDSPHSSDNILDIAKNMGVIAVKSPLQGRAAQMNYGASIAKGDILYFVHADVKIHPDYAIDIFQAITEGFGIGCYRYQFDSKKLILKINAFFNRFPAIWCRGGDQTLFIQKKDFERLSGFRDDYVIMEDYEFIQRANKILKFKIIPKNIIVSARKYETNTYLRVQRANFIVMRMFLRGKASQNQLAETYRRLLNDR